jgi:DNA-binding NarL/FixJ family response regulator
MMPVMDGYETCRRLKCEPATQAIPVIFSSALNETVDKLKGFEVGGVDYISKPFDEEEVIARIKVCLELHRKINRKHKITQQERGEKIAFYQLREREIEILNFYIAGYTRNEIGSRLFISENTVKTHLKNLFIKLNIKDRTEAIKKCREIGLIE